MIISVIYNIALLLSLSVVYATYPFKDYKSLRNHDIIIGFVVGVFGLVIMMNPFVLSSGVVFDSRSILICVSGMAFGIIPTGIAITFMVIYRIWLGGSGMVSGLSVMAVSAFVGILWHIFRYKHINLNKPLIWLEYLAVGILAHVGMLLCMFLLPQTIRPTVLGSMAFPILVLYPIGTTLLCLLIFSQVHRLLIIRDLEDSRLRFKTMFEQAPIGMSLTDFHTGKILDVNQKYLEILGIPKEKLLQMQWKDITYPEDLGISHDLSMKMQKGDDGPFVVEKRFVRGDGQIVWTELAVSVVYIGPDEDRQSLCMTTDISSRKTEEQRIYQASSHDYLTGLYNRGHFEDYVSNLSLEGNLPLSIVFGDINGLGIINEAFGREVGNALIKQIASIINAFMQGGDYAARVGGDEIALLLPNTEAESAEQLMLAIQEQVAEISVMASVHPSITFGLCELKSTGDDINDGIKKAEKDVGNRKLIETPHMRGQAVYAIINTLHEKNKREELHSRRVSTLCEAFAKALEMNEHQVSEIRILGLLHDIGKIAISESILNKEGKLTKEEWSEMKRHPEIGYRILVSVEDMNGLAQYVLAHHERFDGKGYPKSLKGYEIPKQSRIVSIADSYDAMTGERTCRKSVTPEQAALELKKNAGTQFDPDMAKIFVEEVLKLDWDCLQENAE
jgi:diguanylate cyclase (GGDEF)-like protein/PAS domain S-box-containing protein